MVSQGKLTTYTTNLVLDSYQGLTLASRKLWLKIIKLLLYFGQYLGQWKYVAKNYQIIVISFYRDIGSQNCFKAAPRIYSLIRMLLHKSKWLHIINNYQSK